MPDHDERPKLKVTDRRRYGGEEPNAEPEPTVAADAEATPDGSAEAAEERAEA